MGSPYSHATTGPGPRRPRLRRLGALLPTAALVLGVTAVAEPQASAAAGCTASYSVQSAWSNGFVASVAVTNSGTTAITGWTVTFTLGGDQKETSAWGATVTQSIEYITASNASYDGSLAAAASTSFGFQGTFSASDAAPTSVTCTPSSTVTPAIVTTTASAPVMQGFTDTYGVALSAAPTANVTVSVARSSGNSGLTVGSTSASLTFTPTNWNTAQNVTVAADTASTGAATFTASSAGYTSAGVTLTEVARTPVPQLHVSGNKLVDASGTQVILHGVNRSGAEYACVQGWGFFDGPVDEASIQAIKSWTHITAVRVPVNEACWNAESYVTAAYAGANYINAVKTYVNLLNANGIVAILDLHWTDGLYTGNSSGCSSAQATCQKPMPDAAQAIPFWTSVAGTFKGNNAVIFDLFNEPYASRATGDTTTGWQCWENGGTCTGIGYSVAGMQGMVTAIRSTGAANVLMLGGEEYSNDLTGWLTYKPTDPDNNLVASWHSYSFNTCATQACWTSQVAPVMAKVPVIVGETGESDCGGSYIDSLTTWLNSQSTGYLAWTWDAWGSCPNVLITDYTGNPTPFGAAYKAILAALP
ncbi:MAG TPA: cellulase family glycosylhydrolase [Actinocrinis sp.]|uniref:cellulase family glycosylhydrolase n=1 Tax=Actinocrinis sp. TaxID=1920516 RepID=UPI002DDCF0F0|nr:cellulase family glycosylhydrolase [Actinocrinis sp.]HEV2345273.1 cellulase family glycosylhydrolase [Actinocrinis sp.]